MDGYEDNRRGFLRKLGLTLGATMIVSTGQLTASVLDSKDKFQLTPDQQKLMLDYEQWMDEFTLVIRRQKTAPHDIENNKRIMTLSQQAKEWQTEITTYMKDENFARYFMVVTERMTKEI